MICVPGEFVLSSAEACLRRGIRALCVISAGFAETGREGAARQQELLGLVRAHGGRLIGPNCLGVAVAGSSLNATFARNAVPFGNIGFSSQSGALGLALIEAAGARGLGLSAFVSIGNKADVSSNDLLEWWEDDDATRLVLLYLESFGNPRKFARLARRVARSKPILAMKSGHTAAGARAASSHTAALAGSEAAVDALFRQTGVLRADTLEELLDLAALLSRQPLPRGRRVAVLTNAGGLGILCADACEAAGLTLPTLSDQTVTALREFLPAAASDANPVDLLGSATAADYERAVPLLLADPRVDALIALFVPPVSAGADEVADAIERTAQGAEKPVLASLLAAESVAPRPAFVDFPYPESAARALGRAAERADWLNRPAGLVPELARHRPRSGRGSRQRRSLEQRRRRRLARRRRVEAAPRGLRHSARPSARRRLTAGGGRRGARARFPRRGQERCGRLAQDGERRCRARSSRRVRGQRSRDTHRLPRDRAAACSAAAWSCSWDWCRTHCSDHSWHSVRAVYLPS